MEGNKTFWYEYQCTPDVYDSERDEIYYGDTDYFEYKVSKDEVFEALVDIMTDEQIESKNEDPEVIKIKYNTIKKTLLKLIKDDNTDFDCICDTYDEELYDYFKDDAYNRD